MGIAELLMMIGIILVNGGALISFFLKMKLDIAKINIKIIELETKQNKLEGNLDKNIDKLLQKLDKIDNLVTNIRINCVAHTEQIKKRTEDND